jgi:hypothetical protein
MKNANAKSKNKKQNTIGITHKRKQERTNGEYTICIIYL